MKTFNDLEFNDRQYGNGIIGKITFDNGWGVSVVRGADTYGTNEGLYELAVWKDGDIHYDNPIANGDVVGYLREEDVTDAMLIIQKW